MFHLLPGEIVAEIISHVHIHPSSTYFYTKLTHLELGLQQLPHHITHAIPRRPNPEILGHTLPRLQNILRPCCPSSLHRRHSQGPQLLSHRVPSDQCELGSLTRYTREPEETAF